MTVDSLLSASLDSVPPLASFRKQPAQAGPEGVAPLLDLLRTQLQTMGVDPATVAVNVLATAGMRELKRASPAAVRAIYASTRAAIAVAGMPAGRVGTISGRSEGIYSWTGANYLRGVFNRGVAPKGIIEVGGASAQVAFVSRSKNRGATENRNVTKLRIAGKTYPVYSVSYLSLGQDEARAHLISPSARRHGSPCFPNNRAGRSPVFYLGNPVKVKAAKSHYRLSACSTDAVRTITRVGNDKYNAARSGQTAVREIRQTPGFSQSRFIGIASIAYAMQSFGITGSRAPEKLARALHRTCTGAAAWSKVVKLSDGDTGTFTQNACANGTYAHAFLAPAAGVGVLSSQLAVTSTLRGQKLDWTRGFAVIEASKSAS